MAAVDVNAIGAGGGSIAWLDAVGSLKVGPHSAGAAAGPACYGRGGCSSAVFHLGVPLTRVRPAALFILLTCSNGRGGDFADDRCTGGRYCSLQAVCL